MRHGWHQNADLARLLDHLRVFRQVGAEITRRLPPPVNSRLVSE
jgi:hypothetical protein